MANSSNRARATIVVAVTLVVAAIAVFWQPDRVISLPPTTRFPLDLTYEVTAPDDQVSIYQVHIASWREWTYVQTVGSAAGYTVIADGTGQVIAGYPQWDEDQWVELEPAGSKYLGLPDPWFRPVFFEQGREPGEPLVTESTEIKNRLRIAAADDVRGFRATDGSELIYHLQTGIPLRASEPSGLRVRLIALTPAD